ncbi:MULTISPECIES: enoyl-CoA hydratase/isomerase family protein [unclassified Streptomyces]|uniref:enoyl-CoA hydratase/isomerase family protein n=1 Tax=unclassified Streptomyces TaxID=2593676 RepID=UPI00225024BE|nr:MULTISPECIES: enoyl-CoA hydratase/isomerase family protein [unclassified Streptomyces]MCX4989237.1 enoyl-CoA hydratase/isomerase family protein [Streptomyces sp. NBC_00568]MCX5005542.1 enoyl-CoA hydratase/isomerase family protein [Streptomyces sp. NBC_00638]
MAGKRPPFPHIGWDPTPGDVEDTRDLAKKLGGLATELGTALRELERIECGAWKGKTALAFTEYIGKDVTPLIRKSHDSFDKASRALHRWSGELKEFQEEADRLEKAAGEKLEAREKAEQKAEGKGSDELGKASGAVDEVTNKVHDLEDRYQRAAGKISKELDKAGDIAPDEPGFWDKLTTGVADAWDATGQWIKDHADMIKLIGDLLSDLTAVLGLLAIVTLPFPPLAAIFGTAALIGSGLALAAHGLAKAAGADVGWMQIGMDAVGLMPGIGMFSKGIKVAGETADVARVAAAGKAAALGKGFQATDIGSSRILMAFGKSSQGLTGGLGKAGLVKIGGMSDHVYEVSHATSGLMSRMGGLASAGYHEGQWAGSKGLNMIPGVRINPMGAGIAIDAGLKIFPKIVPIHQHIGEALFPGDQFEKSAAGG